MARDPEKKREYDRRYAAANRAKRTQQYRDWRARNPNYERKRHAANPEKVRGAVARYRARHPDRVKASGKKQKLKRTYGITVEQFNAMLAVQEGCCAICRGAFGQRPRDTHVDHCHTTGAVRGLLCDDCNNVLGRARDRPDVLRRAAEYLERR